jgi:Lon protease-like protein
MPLNRLVTGRGVRYMAFKTLQVPSSLARPGTYSFSSSQSSYLPKYASRPQARVATKNHLRSPSVLKCRANLHGCVDEVVRSQLDHQTTEIPIVHYPSVVFPGETLQLQTFEFRYRIMMHTLLQESLTFGIIYSGRKGSRMDDVGCMVHVVECEKLVDDRFFLTCVGGDRFNVLEVVRTKPYVIARVQVLTDRASHNPGYQVQLGYLMQQVEGHLKNVTMLSEKVNWKLRGDHQAGHLSRMHSPESFSFTVARLFVDDRSEQQWLLRLDDTAQRLVREGRFLEQRSKYLAAIAAIRDAFQHLSCNEK